MEGNADEPRRGRDPPARHRERRRDRGPVGVDPARAEPMQRAERLMLSQMPIIPISFYTTQHLVAARARGWIDTVMEVQPTRYLSVVE